MIFLFLLPEKFGELLSILWIAATIFLAITCALFFHFHSDIQLKRVVFRFLTIVYGCGYLMVGFMMMGASRWFLLFGSGVMLIIYFNLRHTEFCKACGKTTFERPFTNKVNCCIKCGAQLAQ